MPSSSNRIQLAVLLDHRREGLADLAGPLRRAGYDVLVSTTVDESQRLVEREGISLAIANPLVARAAGVEFGLLERLQRHGPVPVILVVSGGESLQEARQLDVPLRDFVIRPFDSDELMHRVDLASAALEFVQSLHDRARDLEGQVTNDFKTGLLSERHFRNLLHVEFKRAQRNRTPLSLLLVDVDNFKTINDTTDYGFGDEVLEAVANNLKNSCRETDFAARFGGDEFVVLLPQTTPAEAVQTALRIRKKMSEITIRNDRYATRVTISIGIDTYDGISSSTPEELRRRANKALHEAKRRGKNQAWLFTDSAGEDDVSVPQGSR